MDLDDFYQQNKRFLQMVASGLFIFMIGHRTVKMLYGDDLAAATQERNQNRRDLDEQRYTAQQRDAAADDNSALRSAIKSLADAVAFEPRAEFVLDPTAGSPSGQYFTRVEEVREELDLLASRKRMIYPDGWGIDMLETNSRPVIERQMEALDLIERVARMAAEAGVHRIGRIQVRLDPGFGSRQGLGPVEQTRVSFQLVSTSASVTDPLLASQGSLAGQPLAIGSFEIKNERAKLGAVKAEVEYLVVRLRDVLGEESEEQ